MKRKQISLHTVKLLVGCLIWGPSKHWSETN